MARAGKRLLALVLLMFFLMPATVSAANLLDIAEVLGGRVPTYASCYNPNFYQRTEYGEPLGINCVVKRSCSGMSLTSYDGIEAFVGNDDYLLLLGNFWNCNHQKANLYVFWVAPDGRFVSLDGKVYHRLEDVKPFVRNWDVPNARNVRFYLPIPREVYSVDGQYYFFVGIKPSSGDVGHFTMDGWTSFYLKSKVLQLPRTDCEYFQSILSEFVRPEDLKDFIPKRWDICLEARGLRYISEYSPWSVEHGSEYASALPCGNVSKWQKWMCNCDTFANMAMLVIRNKAKTWGIRHAWIVRLRYNWQKIREIISKEGYSGNICGHSVLVYYGNDGLFHIPDKSGHFFTDRTFSGVLEKMVNTLFANCKTINLHDRYYIYKDWMLNALGGPQPFFYFGDLQYDPDNFTHFTSAHVFGVELWGIAKRDWAREHLKTVEDVQKFLRGEME